MRTCIFEKEIEHPDTPRRQTDGANIEIREEVGADNIFIFGLAVPEVRKLRAEGSYHPWEISQRNPAVARILEAVRKNCFCPSSPGQHDWVCHRVLNDRDPYLHLADLESYLAAQEKVDRLYRDRPAWGAKAILNTARMGKFSRDRTIREDAQDIWGLKAVD